MKTRKEITWNKAGLNDNRVVRKKPCDYSPYSRRGYAQLKTQALRLSFLDVIESWALNENYYISRALEYLSQDSYGEENTNVIREVLKWLKYSQADCVFSKKDAYLHVIEKNNLKADYYKARTLEETLEGSTTKDQLGKAFWWFTRPEGRKGYGIELSEVIDQWNLDGLFAKAIDLLYDGIWFKNVDKGVRDTIDYLEGVLLQMEDQFDQEIKGSRKRAVSK